MHLYGTSINSNGKDTTIAVANGYVIRSLADGKYIFNLNGKLGFTTAKENALIMNVEKGNAPVGNEGIEATEVSVIAGAGQAVVNNAAGKGGLRTAHPLRPK